MKRKCVSPKVKKSRTVGFYLKEDTKEPNKYDMISSIKDDKLTLCPYENKIEKIGEESSDANIFSGACMYVGNKLTPVAIKVMENDFSLELCVLSDKELLDNKIVPVVYDFFKTEKGKYVIIMELLEMTLSRYIVLNMNNTKVFKPMAKKIIRNIHFFHMKGFLHGDLHANNIMLKNGEPYIIDLDRPPKNNDTIKNDLDQLVEDVVFKPLDMISGVYGYYSKQYKQIKKAANIMDDELRSNIRHFYGEQIVNDQVSSSEEESTESEFSEDESTESEFSEDELTVDYFSEDEL